MLPQPRGAKNYTRRHLASHPYLRYVGYIKIYLYIFYSTVIVINIDRYRYIYILRSRFCLKINVFKLSIVVKFNIGLCNFVNRYVLVCLEFSNTFQYVGSFEIFFNISYF